MNDLSTACPEPAGPRSRNAGLAPYYAIHPSVRAAGSDDGIVLLHLEGGKYYSLDPVGVQMWRGLVDCQSRRELGDRLVELFDAPADRIRSDVDQFLLRFAGLGLLEPSAERPAPGAGITPSVPGKHPAAYPTVRMNAELEEAGGADGAGRSFYRLRRWWGDNVWFLRGLWALAYIDWRTRRDEFPGIHEAMVRAGGDPTPDRVDRVDRVEDSLLHQITAAVNRAASVYYRRRWCLQRSAACAYLLRRHGFPVNLVFGVQVLPFIAHAWVEFRGQVINDNPELTRSFAVLHRI